MGACNARRETSSSHILPSVEKRKKHKKHWRITADSRSFALVRAVLSVCLNSSSWRETFKRAFFERHRIEPPKTKDSKTRAELNDLQREAGLQDLPEDQLARFLGQ